MATHLSLTFVVEMCPVCGQFHISEDSVSQMYQSKQASSLQHC